MVLIPEALWEALKEQFWEEDLPNFGKWLIGTTLVKVMVAAVLIAAIYLSIAFLGIILYIILDTGMQQYMSL